MTDLEKLRNWLETFPGFAELQSVQVDLADRTEDSAGVFPGGLSELRRRTDIFGRVTVENRYSFGIWLSLKKAAEDPDISRRNAEWLLELQSFVQEQSARGLVPVFGDRTLRIQARKGALRETDLGGRGLYKVDLTVDFVKEF